MKLGHTLINILSKSQEKRPRRKKFWSFFSKILLKLHFEWQIQPKDEHNQGIFLQNQGTFFDFQKMEGEALINPKYRYKSKKTCR